MQFLRRGHGVFFRTIWAASFAVYLVVATGVPLLPPSPAPKSPDERFPCERSGCGCSSAHQCWTKCCCRSLAANLAWARGEGVRPPEFAIAIARAQGLDTSHWDGPAGKPQKHAQVAAGNSSRCGCCCAVRCQAKSDAPGVDHATGEIEQSAPGIVVLQSLACQGLLRAWLSVGSATPPASVDTCVELVRTAEHLIVLSESASSVADAVDPPPPKLRIS